jgi:hypothetical protein
MRVGLSRPFRRSLVGLGVLGAAWVLAAVPAFGQIPQPKVPEIEKRSGLLTRIVPIQPHLPPDPRRDSFYDTRFGDHADTWHTNSIKGGGLYGKFWRARCTASVYPFFYGSPGKGSIGPECRPWHRSLRYVQGFVDPFRPVGMYYDQGSYVPIHDLDPIVPGPGPYPIPWYYRGPGGG